MKLSEKNREIFIEYLHQKLEQYSSYCSNNLFKEDRIVQPYGEPEKDALNKILENEDGFKSYLEKVLWQCSQSILFDLLCVIDGVADPDDPAWKKVLLIDMPEEFEEDVEFLHDDF